MKLKAVLVLGSIMLASVSGAKDYTDVNNSMGALARIIEEKTQVPGVKQKEELTTPDTDKIVDDMSKDLETCITTQVTPPEIVELDSNGSTMKFKKFHVRVDGLHCPVELESGMDSKQINDEEMEADFFSKMIVKNPDFIKKYNLTQVGLHGKIFASIKQVGSVLATKVKASLTGTGESLVIGAFTQDMNMLVEFNIDMSSFDMSTLMENNSRIKYGSVNDELHGKVKMSGFMGNVEEVYTFNGAEISATDYQKYAASFVIPGLVTEEEQQPGPDDKVPSQCTYAVYDKNKVKASDLRILMKSGTAPKDSLLTGKSCSQKDTKSFQHNGKTYSAVLDFEKDWITFGGSFLTEQEPTSIYLIYQDAIPQTTESDEFTVGLQCQPVSFCP